MTMEDTILYVAIAIISTAALLGTFLIGRSRDQVWMCKILRSLLKRNYIILNIVQKDGRTVSSRIVNVENDVAVIGSHIWIIEKQRVYRKDKPSELVVIPTQKIRWEEGAPMINVDYDNMHPLDYEGQPMDVKSDEAGATLTAWVYNQLAKGLATVNQFKMLQLIVIMLCLLTAGLTFMVFKSCENIQNQVNVIESQVANMTIPGGTIQGGEITIDRGGR